jgi:ring-1,2-phenylacetyl-CoA epoxidase subunit PaaC
MTQQEALFEYLLRLGDNALILGQRLSEWCGHAHQLESDIALTNVALDQIGQCRLLLTEAGNVEGKGRTEDDLAYFRNEREFRNNLLVEQPNENFAFTIARQYFFDVFQYHLYGALRNSTHHFLRGFAAKALKEVTYHRKLSGDWVLRLGDGTDTSHQKMQEAVDVLWPYAFELFEKTDADTTLIAEGIAPDLDLLYPVWLHEVEATLAEATLTHPTGDLYKPTGSRRGHHSEYMGFILAEMQYIPRTMPDAKW